jgi:glycosyltransferase involved in cell wall biosynthesis
MDKKKKILFCVTKGNFGGAQRYVYDLATNLPKERFEIIVASGEGEILPGKLRDEGIRTVRIEKLAREVSFLDEFSVFKELIRIIKTEKPDIIHLNSSKIGGIGALAGRLVSLFSADINPKIIFTAHNWAFNEKNRSLSARLFYYLSHWITILLCHKVIAVSEKTKKGVSFLPFTQEKISVIYNGISAPHFASKGESRSLFGETRNRTVIFSISELNPNKGIDTALRGIAMLPHNMRVKILYVIAGSGEQNEMLSNLAKELGISDNVKFLGYVEEASRYIKGSDIFLLPSRNEAFPYVVLEAGSAGIPIIATSVGGVPEVVKDMQNGILIHPRNPKEVAEAILYLCDHPDKSREFAEEIKKTIFNFFSLQKMLEETEKIYKLA